MTNGEPKLLAFLYMAIEKEQTVLKAVRGGLMVTNQQTLPIELKISTTVKPTKVQIIAYGRRLMEYVFKDLIGERLINSLATQPAAIFVMQPEFLHLRKNSSIPIFLITIEKAENGADFAIATAPGYESDSELVDELLVDLASKAQIEEPFRRIRSLLDQVADVETEDEIDE